jgi:hypothetical protein
MKTFSNIADSHRHSTYLYIVCLGVMAKKMNSNNGPHTACIPKYGPRAVMFYQPNGPQTRIVMTYKQVINCFGNMLSAEEKECAKAKLGKPWLLDAAMVLHF